MAGGDEERVRGLPSIEEARKNRGVIRWPSPKFWGYAGLILTVCFIFHWKSTQSEIEHGRQKLLAQQRGVAAELGPRWYPMRDKIEGWTLGLAKDAGAELVDKEALAAWDFRAKPGLYLRMRVADAKDAEAIRKGAKDSLRDAFTSCLVTFPSANALAGKACRHTRECPTGEHCNEIDHCAKPAQPYNLRVAYKTMFMLSDRWSADVQEASNDIGIRMLQAAFDDTTQDDVPLAIELLTRAQYFMVVLDEGTAEAGQLLETPHQARVAVWRLSDGKLVLRVRREAGGGTLIGAAAVGAGDAQSAARRQANSCALALAVRQSMGDANVPVTGPGE